MSVHHTSQRRKHKLGGALRCPCCGETIHRVHRRPGDRIVSWLVPVRRYRCTNSECRWCGIRVTASKHGPEPTASVQ